MMILRARLAVAWLYTFFLTSLCQQYDYSPTQVEVIDRDTPPLKADTAPIIITGVPVTDSVVRVRQEVRQLQQNTDLWTLFLLALSMMQYTDSSQPLSWYQVAGIHGVPFEPWNGVQSGNGNPYTGYCAHHSVLFPPWHRAYVALYEQVMCDRVNLIASLYTTADLRERYQKAAVDCRSPYFDWGVTPAKGASGLPDSVGGSQTVSVAGPNGVQTISNPLYSFAFQPPDPSLFFNITPWSLWSHTIRGPTSLTATAISNETEIADSLANNLAVTQSRLYALFANYDNYTEFSNEAWVPSGSSGSGFDSLESLHDNVHYELGGGMGHMAIVPFSSFDPIFFLHHTMVDRVFAMWQVLHPHAWVAPWTTTLSTFTIPQGQIVNSATGLTPFWRDASSAAVANGTQFWTPDALRDVQVLGYTYPELVAVSSSSSGGSSLANTTRKKTPQNQPATKKQVVAAINRLYGGGSVGKSAMDQAQGNNLVRRRRGQSDWTASKLYQHEERQEPQYAASTLRKVVTDGRYREWTANIRVKKQALGGPFSIHLGLYSSLVSPSSPSSFLPTGALNVFATPDAITQLMDMDTTTTTTTGMRESFITGTIPLTKPLVHLISSKTISTLEPKEIQPFLVQTLGIKVVRGDGSVVEQRTKDLDVVMASLTVTMSSSVVQVPASEEALPQWAKPDCVFDVVPRVV